MPRLGLIFVISIVAGLALLSCRADAQAPAPAPFTVETNAGPLVVRPLNHASVLFTFGGKNVYVDPSGNTNYAELPKADLILVTHEHGDHRNAGVINTLRKAGITLITNGASANGLEGAQTMANGDTREAAGVKIEAVPAYNLTRGPSEGQLYHPRGRDNGYVLTFGDKRVYLAGDTEGVPEMANLKNIDIAFLPCNLPYTMPPTETAAAAKLFNPRELIPYHQGRSNPQEIADLLKDTPIRVRVIALP